MIRRLAARLRALITRRRALQEADEELQFHLDQEIHAHIARGLAPAEARRLAYRDLGGLTQTQEAVQRVRAIGLEPVWRDLRFAVRTLRASPGFTLVAIFVLALGIGLNTAVSSVVNAMFFRTLPVERPNDLTYLFQVETRSSQRRWISSVYDADFFRARTEVFTGTATHWGGSVLFSCDTQTDRLSGEVVSAGYFDLLGVTPVIGRAFTLRDDELSNTDLAVVIGHDYWTRRFANDPHVVGKRVRLNDKTFTLAGVAPKGFHGLANPWQPSEYWTTSVALNGELAFHAGSGVIARLRPAVSLAQARAFVASQSAAASAYTFARVNGTSPPSSLAVRPLLLDRVSDVQMPFFPDAQLVPVEVMVGVVVTTALVLVIAASNIAGLLVARGVSRTGELAVRTALGASAAALVRQLVTETLCLSCAGGVSGLLLARALLAGYRAFTPSHVALNVTVDSHVLWSALAICVVSALLVGIAPSLQALRLNVIGVLGAGATSSVTARSRIRHWIVIPQIGLSLALLMAAVVQWRSLTRLESAPLGYDIKNTAVMFVQFSEPQPAWDSLHGKAATAAADGDATRRRLFYREMFDAVRDMPGATVGLTDTLPTSSQPPEARTSVLPKRDVTAQPGAGALASTVNVSPGYFAAMGMSVHQGRDFDDRDDRHAPPVVIVSDALARRLWPHGNAVGQDLALRSSGSADRTLEWRRIIGIVNDVDPILQDVGDNPLVYSSLGQQWRPFNPIVVARGGDVALLIPRLKKTLIRADPYADVHSASTMAQVAGEVLYPRRAAAALLGVSAATGFLLACIGLYGVMSFSVSQRLREMGIRVTLGAQHRDVMWLVIREGALVAALGSIPGMVLGVAAIQVTANLVGGAPTMDFAVFAVAPMALACVIFLSCYLPARRAASVAPMRVLRQW